MMNLPKKGISNTIAPPTAATAAANKTLNPNAAEFVPFALRTPSAATTTADVSIKVDGTGATGKAVLDRSESSVSNNSDDEAHQYWRRQLPDDITPDFKFMGEDEPLAALGPDSFSFAGLSVNDVNENSRFIPSTGGGHVLSKRQELSPHGAEENSLVEKISYSVLPYGEDQTTAVFATLPGNPWDKRFLNGDQHLRNGREGVPYNGNTGIGFINDVLSDHSYLDEAEINPVEFLASQFPGFAAESLAEVYYANGCDLNLTIEMLAQLELQVDSGFNPNLNTKTLSAPNLSALDFPALAESETQNGMAKYAGDDVQQSASPYRSGDKDNILFFKTGSSVSPRGAIDFAAAVRKVASQDTGQWKYDRNGSPNASVGSSRSSHVLASSYSGGHVRSSYGDRSPNYGSTRGAPVWLETGEAVANMYSDLREEARDYARLRNAYLEQAQQAYLVGNKALAKELSLKGHLHNMHMKAAHAKAQESIYRQRNPGGRGQEQLIDLHGLHVNEAIHRLRNELSVLRSVARSADQRMQVYICVGTGHHTKGSRTPARLPVAVEQYLLQEEGLEYTETQPGLLRVLIY